MTSTTCWRCLAFNSKRQWYIQHSKSLQFSGTHSQLIAAFTTSTTLKASPLIKKPPVSARAAAPKRGERTTFVVKKKPRPQRTDKPPAVGERRALRKRIVLSNTNAIEVRDMKDVDTESMIDEKLRGQVLGIPGPIIDQLRAAQAFKNTQGWGLFRRPGTLIRQETVDHGKLIESISTRDKPQIARNIFVGEKGSGKSILILQAMTMAFLKKWIVINIPDGKLLTHLLSFLTFY